MNLPWITDRVPDAANSDSIVVVGRTNLVFFGYCPAKEVLRQLLPTRNTILRHQRRLQEVMTKALLLLSLETII